jgi:hypothetical protein
LYANETNARQVSLKVSAASNCRQKIAQKKTRVPHNRKARTQHKNANRMRGYGRAPTGGNSVTQKNSTREKCDEPPADQPSDDGVGQVFEGAQLLQQLATFKPTNTSGETSSFFQREPSN